MTKCRFFLSNNESNTVELNIFHQNVCGINNKVNELELYVQQLNQNKCTHFICLSEHFLNDTMANLLNFTNYKLLSYNTRVNKKRGGTLILGYQGRDSEEVKLVKELFYQTDCFEICCVRDIETGIYIFCCYRTPYERNYDRFMMKLEKLLEHFFNKKCIICGDFNIDLQTPSKKRNDLLNLLKCYNYKPLIFDTATFTRNNSNSCIDNIFTNLSDDNVDNVEIDYNGIGDGHAGLICNINVEKSTPDKISSKPRVVKLNQRMFTLKNQCAFRNRIEKQNWNDLGINTFIKTFNEIFQTSFKRKKRQVNLNNSVGLPWVTRGVNVSSKMKRVLFAVHGNKAYHHSLIDYKKKYIAIYRKVIRCAKRLAIKKRISTSKNISRDMWKIVNRHRNKSKGERQNIALKVNGSIITDDTDVANTFLHQFGTQSMANGNVIVSNDLSVSFLQDYTDKVDNEMIFEPVTAAEVHRVVKKMTTKKSCGYDDIPITVIKDNIDILAKPLSDFFNKCVDDGIFPDQFKIGKIVPIHKKGSRKDPKMYRPISLLPTKSKIFEKIIKSRLTRHLNINYILNERQFGYLSNVGTADAIATLINDVIKQLNEKKKVAGLFLDLSSAFDTVNHNILLFKMSHYGIRGKVLELFKSYLTNRKMYVEISNIDANLVQKTHRSKLTDVKIGVPQGSILGPIFFLIFMNDLINYVTKQIAEGLQMVVFADDTNAIISDDNITSLNLRVAQALRMFVAWFQANSLNLNADKTNLMLFRTNPGNKLQLNCLLEGKSVTTTEVAKFLGVHLDSELKWKQELGNMEKSISSACYVLRSLRDEVEIGVLKTVYFALVEAKIRYSILFWGGSYLYNIQRAFILQKRAIRIMVRIKQQVSCRDYFKELKLLTVPSLYVLVLLSYFAKNVSTFETEEERYKRESTRRKDFQNILRPNFDIVKHCALYMAVKLFNKLPLDLKSSIYHTSFRSKLKSFLLERCLYSIEEL